MPARAESVGLSPEKLRHIERFLDERYISPGRLPCALTLVHRRGETAFLSVLGKSDVERSVPLQEDAIFRIYSMTKPIASLAMMMLIEEGKAQLDDPVHRYIPAWRELGVYAGGSGESGAPFRHKPLKRPMQIVDLLRHTSGLTYGFQQRTNVDAAYRARKIGEDLQAQTLDEMIEVLGRLPLEFSPGDAWNYSVSTDVVGYLVGKISGAPFQDFVAKRILEPLEMNDTGFWIADETKRGRLASLYTIGRNASLTWMGEKTNTDAFAPPKLYSGGGGLLSTAADYLKFCRLMLGRGALGDVRLASPKTIDLMTANHLPGGKTLSDLSLSLYSEVAYAGMGFGLGFSVMTDPAASLIQGTAGEYSWGGAASTYFFVDPKEELILIFMTQFVPSTFYNVRRELRTLVYSAFID
ncbi:MAG: serine hydrolase domain-containing protein [Alphaproteobacteria bacterium]